jgi:hypothetical protein
MKNIYFKYSLVILIFLGVIYYSIYQYIYPQRICVGEITKKIVWTNKISKEKIILKDEKSPLTISFVIKRGAIYLNEDRFPFYKELSGENNIAIKTEIGYQGEYSKYGFLGGESFFKFKFNEVSSFLYTENDGKALHLYENKEGIDSAKLEFIGACSKKLI